MKITIKATNLEINSSIKEYIEKKIGALDKFFRSNHETIFAAVEIALTTNHHRSGDIFRAEINLSDTATDMQIYAEAKKEDLYAAIDEMKDKAERECLTLKDKKLSMIKRGAARFKKMLRYRN